MSVTGGPPPSIGPNKYRFLYKMLCVNVFARAPAESLLRVYERRKQQQLTATVSRFYYLHRKKSQLYLMPRMLEIAFPRI